VRGRERDADKESQGETERVKRVTERCEETETERGEREGRGTIWQRLSPPFNKDKKRLCLSYDSSKCLSEQHAKCLSDDSSKCLSYDSAKSRSKCLSELRSSKSRSKCISEGSYLNANHIFLSIFNILRR
jgi:hypothetical protein